MAISSFEGIVEHGQIRLPNNLKLAENTKVYVLIPDLQSAPIARIYSPRLVHPEQARDFAKQVIEVSTDAQL